MEIINTLWSLIISGSPAALNGLLFAIVIYLLWERQKMTNLIIHYQHKLDDSRNHYQESIEKILDRYHQGTLEMVQALNEIKVVLATMQKTIF